MSKMKRLSFAATLFLLGFTGKRASAQSCSADTDCPQSFVCSVTGTSTAPVCKGTGCPADAGAADPVVYKACQPKACATDADCGAGMVCYQQKSTACSGGGSTSGCAPNAKCDAGTVVTTFETCTTTTRNVCAFKWELPCNADVDCGDGFVCQPTVSGGCATSGRGVSAGPNSTGGASSGSNSSSPPAADAGAPDCPTTTSFPGSCRAKATTCTADAECPGGWTCTAIATPTPITGGGAPVSVHGEATAALPADAVDAGGSATKVCIGPFGAGEPTRGAVDVGTGSNTTTGAGHEGTGAPAPTASGGGKGGTTGGATTASAQSSGGGCAISPARADQSTLLLIGVATIGLVLARRRSRK